MAFLGVSSGTYDLPCSCKTKTELNALNELLGTDEKIEKKSHAWSEKTLPEAAKQDEGLWAVYGLLSFEDRNTRSQSGKQVLLTAWQVCDSSRDHEGGYLMNYDESKRSPSKRDAKLGSSRSRSSSAREPKNLETFTRRCDFVKENIKPQTNQECERQEDGRISRLGRSASPHKAMKFHHFKRITEHMRYYRETITASATRRHVQIQVQKSKKAVKPPQAHSKAENMTFCKFCVSTTSNMNDKEDQKNGFGILRVSPCLASPKTPSKNTKDKLSQKEANKLREEIKSDSFNSSASRKTLDIPKKETVLLRRSEKCRFSISSVAKNYSEGKASPCTMLDYEKKLILSPSCRDFVKRSVPDEEKKTSEIRPVKKVELQVCRPPMLSVGNGNGKGRGYGACYSRRSQPVYKQSTKAVPAKTIPLKLPNDNVTNSKTLPEKEFLHITTPKMIASNPGSNKDSTTKLTEESENPQDRRNAPLQVACYTLAQATDTSSIPRSRLLGPAQPTHQTVASNTSSFQACITPSGYAKSSVSAQLRKDKPAHTTRRSTREAYRLEPAPTQKIPSKASISNIVPFM